jgi:8-oxo-dGTP pyrophosphatase MutT (NUDIX family)
VTLAASAEALLRTWDAPDPTQESLRDDFLSLVDERSDAWSRTCLPDHLTASVVVLDPTRSRVLLAHHRKVGLWLQFGGHIESSDQSLVDAARREVLEESGLRSVEMVSGHPVRLDRHLAPCGDGARHHLDVEFAATASPHEHVVVSSESFAVSWFDVDSLPSATDDALRRLVAAARSFEA